MFNFFKRGANKTRFKSTKLNRPLLYISLSHITLIQNNLTTDSILLDTPSLSASSKQLSTAFVNLVETNKYNSIHVLMADPLIRSGQVRIPVDQKSNAQAQAFLNWWCDQELGLSSSTFQFQFQFGKPTAVKITSGSVRETNLRPVEAIPQTLLAAVDKHLRQSNTLATSIGSVSNFIKSPPPKRPNLQILLMPDFWTFRIPPQKASSSAAQRVFSYWRNPNLEKQTDDTFEDELNLLNQMITQTTVELVQIWGDLNDPLMVKLTDNFGSNDGIQTDVQPLNLAVILSKIYGENS